LIQAHYALGGFGHFKPRLGQQCVSSSLGDFGALPQHWVSCG
jgi:hypothetical protein